MGVAPARAPGSIFLQLVLVIVLLLQDVVAQQDQIVFNTESTAYVLEEQPVGTVAAVLEAFYLLYSPFQLGTDGFFTLNTSQPDAQFFTIDSAPNEAGSATLGMLRTAAVLDRDGEGAQTTFALTVTYSTPDGYLSSQRSVSILTLIPASRSPGSARLEVVPMAIWIQIRGSGSCCLRARMCLCLTVLSFSL